MASEMRGRISSKLDLRHTPEGATWAAFSVEPAPGSEVVGIVRACAFSDLAEWVVYRASVGGRLLLVGALSRQHLSGRNRSTGQI
jgi:hypothetical protein